MRHTYTDADRAAGLAALRANGGNIRKTSRETGVPFGTLHAWAADQRATPGVKPAAPAQPKSPARSAEPAALAPIGAAVTGGRVRDRAPVPQSQEIQDAVASAEGDLAGVWEGVLRSALGAISPAKLQNSSAAALATVAAIATDKMRVLEGNASQIVEHRGARTNAERAQRLRDFLALHGAGSEDDSPAVKAPALDATPAAPQERATAA